MDDQNILHSHVIQFSQATVFHVEKNIAQLLMVIGGHQDLQNIRIQINNIKHL